ncbi:exodeoxyribonuclease VII small subunit [Pusillimonas sp. ANT_WB101]|uniref:exodeoxyribonuclease VII small subunit n=1 Tax=Pusillimonas sp. ANT_WB101 TaxID=2597356 RepID=UPI0011EE4B48|nr:exodeoxyribonuclease VII small subunit [Pusillimonas sp. ANT_WB101]KAA0888500.1 exodeoxyribonuclease VII small subunit [Pusillimonas sp. ANT_WB101]
MNDTTPAPLEGAEDNEAGLPQDFETALAQLEALVAQMENGSLPLEQSLAAYEKGVALTRICQRRLDQAEQQVKVLQENLLQPFSGAAGDEG